MRRTIRPLTFTLAAVAALVGFVLLGRVTPAPIAWRDLSAWTNRTEPVDAFGEFARHLGIVLAAYVALVSAAALATELAAAARMPRLHRRLRQLVASIAVPALRHRLLEVTTAATITASALQLAPAGAQAQTIATPAVVDDMPDWHDTPMLRGEFHGFGMKAVDSAPTYTVRPGDTLWSIADRHYGIADASLVDLLLAANPIIRDSDLIQVGWHLVLPSVDPAQAPAPPVEGDATWTVVSVQRGDTLWDIVDDHYGHATGELVWTVVEANPELEDPSLIFAGQQITLPPVPAQADEVSPSPIDEPTVPVEQLPPPSPPPPSAPARGTEPDPSIAPTTSTTLAPPLVTHAPVDTTITSTSSATSTASSVVSASAQPASSDELSPSLARTLGWAGGAGLAAAVIGLAARRRRRMPARERHRRPTDRAVQVGIALHETPLLSTVDRAAVALRALASQMRPRAGEPTSVPRLLRLADDQIELVWDTPNSELLDPWTSSDGGWSWTLDRNATLNACDGPSPCPTLITIGQRDGADVLLNLESCGVLSIDGARADVDVLVRSIALELSASTLADAPTILLVGLPRLPAAPEAALAVDVDEAAAWLRDRANSATALLAHRRLTSLFALRARARIEDAHEAAVVFVDPDSVQSERLDELVALANGDLGAVLVVLGELEAATWTLFCADGSVTLQPVGLELTCVGLDVAASCLVEEFVPPADPADDVFADEPEPDAEQLEMVLADHVVMAHQRVTSADASDEPDQLTEWDVELKVLGEVRCVGAREPLTPTELHMAVVLAFHPNGLNSDTLATLVWPNGVAERTMTNAMASLRRKLGTGSDGELLFPLGRTTEHRYRLSGRVMTDWHRFVDLVRRSESAAEDEAVELLDEALVLVDGPPFRAAAGYSWAYSDGTAMLITDTASLVSARCAHIHADRLQPLERDAALAAASRLNGAADSEVC